jgi:hypothetical protein
MDSFLDPSSSASLNAILARLQGLDGEIGALRNEVAEQSVARKEGRGATQGEGLVTDKSVTYLKEGQAVIQQQVLSYTRLNELITKRIGLEREAAAEVSKTGGAVGVGTTDSAAARTGGASPKGVLLPPGVAAGQTSSLELMAGRMKATAVTADELGVSEEELAYNIQKANMAMVDSSDAMFAHGAMSTEFLAALSRGEVGLADIGSQMAQTIGKFGAWTAAAAGVYGVIDAISKLRTGAVDADSAVQGLTKFVPNLNKGEARQQIITQSQQTVTPIADVGATAQQFSKAFHNQSDVFTATHVALTAAKLDTISLADSYKYLTAIVQELNMPVSKLPALFDQITAAQDRVGARMSTVLPAFAGSLAAVTIGGGDPSQLLALEALAAKRTPQSGATIATAFQRGATNPTLGFENPSNKAVLERLGVNPNQGMTQALIETIRKIGSGQLPEGTSASTAKEEAAGAFFGKQFGGRMASLFNVSPKALDQALQQTSAGGSKGLADRQLGKTTDQADQQISKIGINLEAIGAEIGGSGLLGPIGMLVGGFNGLLEVTKDLLVAWNAVPGPIKEFASGLLVARVALAGMRRVGVGEMLTHRNGPISGAFGPILQKDPDKVLNTDVNKYGREAITAQQTDVNRAASINVSSQKALQDAQQRYAAELDAGFETQAEANSASRRLTAAENKAAEAAATAAVEQDRLATMQTDLAAYRRDVKGGMSPQEAAGARGTLFAYGEGAAASGGGQAAASQAATQAAREETVAQQGLTAAMAESDVALSAGGKSILANAAAQRAATVVTEEETASQGMLASAMGAAATGVAAFSSEVASLTAMLMGPALVAFAGYTAITSFDHAAEKRQSTAYAGINAATSRDAAINAYNTGQGGAVLGRGSLVGAGFQALYGGNGEGQALQGKLAEFAAVDKAQGAAATNLSQVNDWMRKAGEAAQGSKGQVTDLQSALTLLGQNKVLQGTDPGAYKLATGGVESALNKAQGPGKTPSNPFAQYQGNTVATDVSQLQGLGKAGQVFGVSGVSDRLAAAYATAVKTYGGESNPDKASMSALSQAKSSFDSALNQSVSDLETAAKNSTTNAGQSKDYAAAVNTITQTTGRVKAMFDMWKVDSKGHSATIRHLNDAEKQVTLEMDSGLQTLVQDQLDLASAINQLATSSNTGVGPEADLQRAQETLKGDLSQLTLGKKVHANASEMNTLQTQANQQIATVLQDKVNYIQQFVQGESQLDQAGEADPIQQAETAIRFAQSELQQLKAAGSRDQVQMNQLLATIAQAQVQMVQQLLSNFQTQQQTLLAQADTGQNAIVQANNAVNSAQVNLSHILALGAKVPESTKLQAYQGLAQAQQQQAQAMLQEGQSLITAQSSLAQSTTTNPVTIAADVLAGDQKLLAYMVAHKYAMSQIVQQQAQVGDDIKSLNAAKYQLQEQTIEFQASTYQITGAQEIQQLTALYQKMKKQGASVTSLQQIYQEIFNLEYGNTGNLNLNTGNMHLPSTYEVKSAIQGGANASKRKTNAGLLADVKTTVQMNVVINKDVDIKKLTNAMGEALNTSVNGLATAAGLV